MMTLGAHELLIIAIAWLVIVFGPVLAKVTIAMVRRHFSSHPKDDR